MTKKKNCLNCYWWAASDNPSGFECRCEFSDNHEQASNPSDNCPQWIPTIYFDEGKGRMMSPDIAKERLEAGYDVIFIKKERE